MQYFEDVLFTVAKFTNRAIQVLFCVCDDHSAKNPRSILTSIKRCCKAPMRFLLKLWCYINYQIIIIKGSRIFFFGAPVSRLTRINSSGDSAKNRRRNKSYSQIKMITCIIFLITIITRAHRYTFYVHSLNRPILQLHSSSSRDEHRRTVVEHSDRKSR